MNMQKIFLHVDFTFYKKASVYTAWKVFNEEVFLVRIQENTEKWCPAESQALLTSAENARIRGLPFVI